MSRKDSGRLGKNPSIPYISLHPRNPLFNYAKYFSMIYKQYISVYITELFVTYLELLHEKKADEKSLIVYSDSRRSLKAISNKFSEDPLIQKSDFTTVRARGPSSGD